MSLDFLNLLLSCFARALGMLAILPIATFFTGFFTRSTLAFILALICALDYKQQVDSTLLNIVLNFCVGVMLSMPARLVVVSFEAYGEFLDAGRGQTIAAVYNPMTESPSSQTSTILSSLSWSVLVYLGYLIILFQSYFQSFKILHPGINSFQFISNSATQIFLCLNLVVQASILHYLPLAAVFLGIDVIFAFCSKSLNNTHLYSENFQLKTYLSLLLLVFILNSDLDLSFFSIALPRLDFFKTP